MVRQAFCLVTINFYKLSLLVGLILLLNCQSAPAKEIALSTDEIRIPKGESRSFDLGTIPQKEKIVFLDVLARLDADSYAGSSYFMKITLNGHVINAARTRTVTRILNKNLVSPVAPNLNSSWFGNNAWRVLYAPDFGGTLKHLFYEDNPYQTVLDVTDLVNPVGTNRLEIFNIAKSSPPTSTKANHDLVLKNLIVRVEPGVSKMIAPTTVDQDGINRGAPGAGPAAYTGQLLSGGGFSLKVANKTFRFSSRISYPNAGMNSLTASDKPSSDGQTGFKVSTVPTKDGGQVIAVGPDYRIVRTVRFTPRKIEICDRITNLHQDMKLGLLFENGLKVEGMDAKVRLAGIPDNSINQYYSPGNPSVYFAMQNVGLGMIIEDDIFRNQATLFYGGNTRAVGVRTDKLCLPASGSYTLQWSVYPVASNDYYDFINLVRHDWGANYTVEGAWTFFNPDTIIATPVEDIREQFARLGIKRACSWGGWVDRKHDRRRIGFGTGVLDDYWADYRKRIRMAAEKIHEAIPDCKVYVYYDTQRDTSEGGRERFKDSWLSDEKGAQTTTDWGGAYSRTYSVVATLENSFGKAMLATADWYMTEMKVDGLYWDEMEGVGYGQPLVTYNVSDGYSCELDPVTYTIKREIGINTIMGEKHRVAVIKKVRERGGDLMGNGPISTKSILALKPQRMIEIQHNDYWNYEGNLGSPLGYAASRTDFGNWVRALNMATLLIGTRYDYGYDISRYVFPFTPIELHPGYLLGRERIIATNSGSYGWPGAKCLVEVRYFDSKGKLTERDFKTMIADEARTETTVGKDEVVVLVKLPVTVTATQGQATIQKAQYGLNGLKFLVQASNGFSLEIRQGEMAVNPGQKFNLKIGNASTIVSADDSGVLTINFGPTPTSLIIEVVPQ